MWEAFLCTKLSGPGVGSKTWWTLIKEKQVLNCQETILPLSRPDRTCVTSSREKAELLAEYFAAKIAIKDPRRPPPHLEQEAPQMVTAVERMREKVVCLLRGVNNRKATGPDNVNPRTLKHCASELAGPFMQVFTTRLEENSWPSMWKEAQVVPVHKRSGRMESGNYKLISLLSVVGKVFERVVANEVCHHLDDNLSNQQFGFRAGWSTSSSSALTLWWLLLI